MLQHFKHDEAAAAMLSAIEKVLSRSDAAIMTPDMGGSGTTEIFGNAVMREILAEAADGVTQAIGR